MTSGWIGFWHEGGTVSSSMCKFTLVTARKHLWQSVTAKSPADSPRLVTDKFVVRRALYKTSSHSIKYIKASRTWPVWFMAELSVPCCEVPPPPHTPAVLRHFSLSTQWFTSLVATMNWRLKPAYRILWVLCLTLARMQPKKSPDSSRKWKKEIKTLRTRQKGFSVFGYSVWEAKNCNKACLKILPLLR